MNVLNDKLDASDSFGATPEIAKAAEDSRTPKPGGGCWALVCARAFWSAAVLCRFFCRLVWAQRQRDTGRKIYHCVLLLSVCTFMGCKSFRPVEDLNRFYVLSAATKASTEVRANQSLTIGVAPLDLPGYLQSTRIAIRKGTNEIYYPENRQWAEHLDKGIQRVLASDLSSLIPTARVITSAWQPGDVTSEVHVTIRRFELDESGLAALECEWRIVSPDNARVLHLDHALITKKGPSLAANPTGAVNTLSQTLGELSNQIAAALKTSGS